MAEIDDFNSVEAAPIEDFLNDKSASVGGLNRATSEQRASHASLLEGDPTTARQTYSEIKSDMMNTGYSAKADAIVQEKSRLTIVQEQNALRELVTDDTISFEEKKAATEALIDRMNGKPNLRDEVSQKALAERSVGETAEMETVRINAGARIRELNAMKKERQAMLNSAVAQSNPTTMDTVVDFFESVIPFTSTKRLSTLVSNYKNEQDLGERAKTFGDMVLLTGSDKRELITALSKMSPEDQMSASQSIIDAINSSDELVLPDENDLTRVDFLKTFLEDGYYTTADEWIDNVVSLLDLTVLGSVVGRSVRAVKTLTKPTSVAENLRDTNPGKAKSIHEATRRDETGEVAEASYGTTRTDAVADDVGYEIAEEEGVRNKVGNVGTAYDQSITPDADVMEAVKSDGAIYYWEDEKKRARAAAFNDFQNPTGLRLRSEMQSVVSETDKGLSINAIYGPTDGGFQTAQDAFETTKLAMRKYGITDDNIELMMQRGDKYVPVPKALTNSVLENKLRPVGGFMTRVKYDYEASPLDIEEWSKANVKWNIFDRIPGSHTRQQGSLQRNILDAHSMLHPTITKGATVAVDKAAGLEKKMLELGSKFTEGFTKLPKERQDLVFDYILEANSKGIGLDRNRLIADGYNEAEFDVLTQWKNYWDTHYVLENQDALKSLRNGGYMTYSKSVGDTTLFAKPVAKNQLRGAVEVYDAEADTFRTLSKQELDDIYENEGTIAKLRTPLEKGDDSAEFIFTKGVDGPYLRTVNKSDQALNYRQGYYSVQYTAPKFIVKRVKDKNGKVKYERAIQMAGNTRDAELAATRLARSTGKKYDNSDPNADFFVRDNIKGNSYDSDDYWSVQVAGGRSAQRVRGERLEDASGETTVGDKEWIMGPVDSLIHSARSIARRVPMREYLDTTKTRFLDQYKNVLPKDEFGQPAYPKSASEIGATGRKSSKEAADARTTYEYINSLEDGYINGMDEAYKATLKLIGNILGEASKGKKGIVGSALAKAEEGVNALSEAQGPTGFAKNVAFQTYLASHPLRQAVVQSHQTILLTAINPTYMVGGGFFREMTAMGGYLAAIPLIGEANALRKAAKFAGMKHEDFAGLVKAWENSGMGAAVDKQNLVRGTLSELATYGKYGATQSTVAKVAKPITAPLNLARRVGFDTGEYFNSLGSWMAYHNKALNAKKGKLTQADYDNISANARNISLNMNQAGEMPYNQNSLGLFFQFLQVPHKMFTMMAFNRGLTFWERSRLAGLNFLLFGTGGTAMYNFIGPLLPEDPELRDAVSNGVEGFVVNTVLSKAYEGNTRIDFSSVAPTDMYGLSEFITSLWTEEPGNILAASPAGQLFFGANPRITNAFKDAAKYFHLMDDGGDPVQLSQVFEGFAKISSGYSAYAKAKMAMEYELKRNAYGKVIDTNVTTPEAIGQLFGFNSLDERDYYIANNASYAQSKAFEDDFKTWYRDMKRRVVASGANPEESEFAIRIQNAGLHMFGDNKPRFQRLLMQQLRYDVEVDKDYSLYKSVIRAAGFMDGSELKKYMEAIPIENAEVKGQLMQLLEYRFDGENE